MPSGSRQLHWDVIQEDGPKAIDCTFWYRQPAWLVNASTFEAVKLNVQQLGDTAGAPQLPGAWLNDITAHIVTQGLKAQELVAVFGADVLTQIVPYTLVEGTSYTWDSAWMSGAQPVCAAARYKLCVTANGQCDVVVRIDVLKPSMLPRIIRRTILFWRQRWGHRHEDVHHVDEVHPASPVPPAHLALITARHQQEYLRVSGLDNLTENPLPV
ncbi:unnamed protein product [Vitrella brassicaformis CCMP3155]|uniref:Uncharacterized protein n=1 Tax=Vitrella brassicaformis (strain CCMP3155) TaxID=1169540 RepID=A0A0G4GC41_VITBC|nr:unnamed protein product [Vitrella brassicaformis CCMP3155]|eukprot:CEM26705.1 unnamed protein product [Vitrella brassicaformis CCMP3155]